MSFLLWQALLPFQTLEHVAFISIHASCSDIFGGANSSRLIESNQTERALAVRCRSSDSEFVAAGGDALGYEVNEEADAGGVAEVAVEEEPDAAVWHGLLEGCTHEQGMPVA
ncbi:hypothetical protein PsAD14_05247 [Pseudovibrio sp. Ad14]|nr:hypothetical protein PsW74_00003 [Pseudovibrio sp. W74]KZL04192.1 hypothetical protein PsAD14_05247 [Pseudovibrio sp. Ad14]